VQIGHRREVIRQVNGQATLGKRVPQRRDGNVLIGDRAAKSFRIFLRIKTHVLGLRTGQVIDLADVRLRIGEQRKSTRATSSIATGEVLPSPSGSLIWSDSLTESAVKSRKKFSIKTGIFGNQKHERINSQ
jgi:hypothetical protein